MKYVPLSLCVALTILFAGQIVAHQRVYFLGNSFTEFSYPFHIEPYAELDGADLVDTASGGKIGYTIYSGKSLDYEVNNPTDYVLTNTGGWINSLSTQSWDVVVMQPHTYQSGIPFYHEVAAAKVIIDMALSQNPNTVFYILEPYAFMEGPDPGSRTYNSNWTGRYKRQELIASMTPWRALPKSVTGLDEYATLFNSKQNFQSLYFDAVRSENPTADVRWIPLGEVVNQIDLALAELPATDDLIVNKNLTGAWKLVTDRVHLGFYNGSIHGRYIAHLTALSTIWNRPPEDFTTVFDTGTSGPGYAVNTLIYPNYKALVDPIIKKVVSAQKKRHYVDADADGNNDGSTWEDAYLKLQDALSAAATQGGEIWVANGIYYPDEGNGITEDDRSATFQLISGVSIYGGFKGYETSWIQRDSNPATNGTMLSGDIDQNDSVNFTNSSNNAYHVVTGTGVNTRAILDGFKITGGNAPDFGGALRCSSSGSPTLRNCEFEGNQSALAGGAIYLSGDSDPQIFDCDFENNKTTDASGKGGAFYAELLSHAFVYQCTFRENNSALGGAIYTGAQNGVTLMLCSIIGNSAIDGGGLYSETSSTSRDYEIINCEFTINTASNEGGAIYTKSRFTITNGTFAGNSAIQGAAISKESGSITLHNCVVWDNTNTDLTGAQPKPQIKGSISGSGSNNLIQDASVGGSVILTSDPLFVRAPNLLTKDPGDLSPQPSSPILNQGNPNGDLDSRTGDCCEPVLVKTGDLFIDLSGNPRINSTELDLGAYELKPYFSWTENFYPGESDLATIGYEVDDDGDYLSNLEEIGFNLNPNIPVQAPLVLASETLLNSPGLPVIYDASGVGIPKVLFTRPTAYEALGLSYKIQFSYNMMDWIDSTETPTVLDSILLDPGTFGSFNAVELVSVPYGLSAGSDQDPKLFRVQVELN